MKFLRPYSSDSILLDEVNQLKIEGDKMIIPIWIYQSLLCDAAYMHGMIEGMLIGLELDDTK